MREVFVIGDSHSNCLRRVAEALRPEAKSWLHVRPFGAVRQGIRFHHEVDGETIKLLEENWPIKALPFDPSHRNDPDVLYILSMPYNYSPLLRAIEYDRFTIDPTDEERDFLSEAAVSALIHRRNRLGIALARDMRAIGLNVAVIEAPRIFENRPFVDDMTAAKAIGRRYFEETAKDLDAAGVPIIRQPPNTIGADGLTLAAFAREGDYQHGNSDLYALMIDAISALATADPVA